MRIDTKSHFSSVWLLFNIFAVTCITLFSSVMEFMDNIRQSVMLVHHGHCLMMIMADNGNYSRQKCRQAVYR